MARIYQFPHDKLELDLSALAAGDLAYDIFQFPKSWIQKSSCSEEDKKDLLPVFVDIFSLHHHFQDGGVLSLEKELPLIHHSFLGEGIQMLLNGTSPEEIDHRMTGKIRSSLCSGRNLLEKLLIRTGILSMAVGNLPGTTHTLLMDLFDFEDPTCVVDILLNALMGNGRSEQAEIIPFESC